MPLLGRAAMLLSFDIVQDAIDEHDDWHTRKHLPERLSTPGFLRGSRWVAVQGAPRYLVIYEVEQIDTLASADYLRRLNSPSPWTAKMMPSYRGMTRGLCSVIGSSGLGMGGSCLLARFGPAHGPDASMRRWLCEEALPALASKPGLGSAHLLEGAASAEMTNEQRIRGADAFDCALVVTGYDRDRLTEVVASELLVEQWPGRGALDLTAAVYQLAYPLSTSEIGPFDGAARSLRDANSGRTPARPAPCRSVDMSRRQR